MNTHFKQCDIMLKKGEECSPELIRYLDLRVVARMNTETQNFPNVKLELPRYAYFHVKFQKIMSVVRAWFFLTNPKFITLQAHAQAGVMST